MTFPPYFYVSRKRGSKVFVPSYYRYIGRFYLNFLVLHVKKQSQNATHLIFLSEVTPERFRNGHEKT